MYIRAYKTVDDSTIIETYTEIKNLSFVPSTDLVGASVPINEFEVDIHTTDTIEIGAYVELYDDNDRLWASYWAIYAEHIDIHTLRLRCQSNIAILDRVKLPAIYYESMPVDDVLFDTILWKFGASDSHVPMTYSLDSSFNSVDITGFCPEQTARERLTWVCFVIGAYVKTYFNNEIEILPIDNTETLIPISKTYWKPINLYNDWVTAIVAKAYSFTLGEPSVTDEYVKDYWDDYYIVTETTITLENPDAPSAAPDNVVMIDDVYLINNDNVSALLSRLAQWYFKRMEVNLEVINNGDYIPAEKVVVYLDDAHMVTGYINSAEFSFGKQSKSKLHMTAVDNKEGGNLTIFYLYESTQIEFRTYLFPVGYSYTITNPYLDKYLDMHRYVFRPLNENATGTIVSGDNTNTQSYDIALDLYESVLHIISVDQVTEDESSEIVIGVIA